MNWRRGLTRLWLVASALWAVAAVASLLPSAIPEIRAYFGPVIDVHPDEIVIIEGGTVLRSPLTILGGLLLFALGPPALVYGLGRALGWALAGFQRPPAN